ncbi:phage tail assembly protein [Alloalcanivorax xenomutans]|uniref:phage tail assembly protein n=1 Tax=Alloalcanivorax xenomutans TaxID=1094342 RepID=UPI003BA9AD37
MATPVIEQIDLESPITIGDKEHTTLTLRRPVAGELRGLSLSNVLNADVETLMVLVPRIAQPTLTRQHVAEMDLADLGTVAGTIAGFFQPASQK